MASQQDYLDSWTKMSEQMAGTFQPKKPRNPWIEALEQWESFIPNTGESQPYAARMLNQGKAFFQMSEEISTFLNMLNDVNKSTDDWQQTLQSQMEGIKNAFDTGQGDLAAFWDQPLDAWQSAIGDSVLDPEAFFKNFDHKQGMEDMINPVYDEMNKLLGTPGVGPDRETHEKHRNYTRLWMDYQRANQEYNTAHHRVGKETIERLMQQMIDLSETGGSLNSMREVYDLWIDCAEEAYADFAYSDEYQDVYGRMINSLMALKQESRSMIDETASSLGLPSSKGFDTVLRRMQEMRREIRKLQHAGNQNQGKSSEVSKLRTEIAALRKELGVVKKSMSSKPAIATAKKTIAKKKIALTRKKVAKKKVASRKPGKKG